jgi:hypothetical protein
MIYFINKYLFEIKFNLKLSEHLIFFYIYHKKQFNNYLFFKNLFLMFK